MVAARLHVNPTMSVPLSVTDPGGRERHVYTVPGYRPPPRRVESIAAVIQSELGPLTTDGIGAEARELLGMNRQDALGLVNRAIMSPIEGGIALLDLANYGISAAIVAGTEGIARAGWMSKSDAGSVRRDLMLLSVVIGLEAGRSVGAVGAGRRRAQASALAAARSSARAVAPVLVRSGAAGLRSWFRVVEVVEVDRGVAGGTGRGLADWLARVRKGRQFDLDRNVYYDFNQVYVTKNSGSGYWVLDSYGPKDSALGAGPVSRKFTQIADVQIGSAKAMLQQAQRKYRSGTSFADVPSRPARLMEKTVQGQLWLEVPVQIKPVPAEILVTTRQLGIKIRDVSGRVY